MFIDFIKIENLWLLMEFAFPKLCWGFLPMKGKKERKNSLTRGLGQYRIYIDAVEKFAILPYTLKMTH